jgi:threonine aldolase
VDFTSDNASGVAPQILAAFADVNHGTAAAYGDDEISARARGAMSELFEREVATFLVATGSAANALALAVLTPPYGTIFAHEEAHIHVDECAAPEFYSGGAKIIPLPGEAGKIDADALALAIEKFPRGVIHRPQPGALSLTQSTEFGTVYSQDELAALIGLAKDGGIGVHMDGARFANAVASSGLSPAEATWKQGVDVLSFGATKNGGMGAEAVVFFDPDKADDFQFRQKRAGQVFSKGRFPAAQFEAYLKDGLWLKMAGHANAQAKRLTIGLKSQGLGEPVHAADANEIFIALPLDTISVLRKSGARFHNWPAPPRDGKQLIRLVTSFQTSDEDVDGFLAALASL